MNVRYVDSLAYLQRHLGPGENVSKASYSGDIG